MAYEYLREAALLVLRCAIAVTHLLGDVLLDLTTFVGILFNVLAASDLLCFQRLETVV